MDNLNSILDLQLLDFSITSPNRDWSILPRKELKIKQKEILEHRKDFVNLILKEIKDYYLNKLPKEKKFDSLANSSKESINNTKIYNNCLNQIKAIIKKG